MKQCARWLRRWADLIDPTPEPLLSDAELDALLGPPRPSMVVTERHLTSAQRKQIQSEWKKRYAGLAHA